MYEVPASMTRPRATSSKPAWAVALKKRREEVVGSQEELAARAGISQSLVSQIERGVHNPTDLSVERFSKLLSALLWNVAAFEAATGLMKDDPDIDVNVFDILEGVLSSSATLTQVKHTNQLPNGLREAVQLYGKRHSDLQDPAWQQYLAGFRWRDSGQPDEPERWLDLYRDLIRAGVVPGAN